MVIRTRPIDRRLEGAPSRAATLQFLRASEVCALLRISRPTLWRLRRDREFPAPTALSRRSIGWRQSDVEQWLDARTAQDPKASRLEPAANVACPPERDRPLTATDATARRPGGPGRSTRSRRASQLDMAFGCDPDR